MWMPEFMSVALFKVEKYSKILKVFELLKQTTKSRYWKTWKGHGKSHGIWRAQKSMNPAGSYCQSRQDSRRKAKLLVAKVLVRSWHKSRQDSHWISWVGFYMVMHGGYIHGQKVLGPYWCIKTLINSRQLVGILSCLGIQEATVHTHVQGTILFPD